jgi:hypothetical protein
MEAPRRYMKSSPVVLHMELKSKLSFPKYSIAITIKEKMRTSSFLLMRLNAIITACPSLSSSLLKAFALGQQEWFIQLCRGKKAVPWQQSEYSSPRASRNGLVISSVSSFSASGRSSIYKK